MTVKNGTKTAFEAQKGKGRPKGRLNKTTVLAKSAIAEAAEKLGGTDRLVAWAKENPDNEKVFWSSMYTKLMPIQTEVSGPDGSPIQSEAKLDMTALSTEALRELSKLPIE